MVMVPSVHMNGTGRDELLQQLVDAITATEAAIAALNQAMPNGRDYYVQSPTAIDVATREWRDRVIKVAEVHSELTKIAEAL